MSISSLTNSKYFVPVAIGLFIICIAFGCYFTYKEYTKDNEEDDEDDEDYKENLDNNEVEHDDEDENEDNIVFTEASDIDDSLFDAPAPVVNNKPSVSVKPVAPKPLPDITNVDKTLADYYTDNLRGDNTKLNGINDELPDDNYNTGYTLGVKLDATEAKDLGVVHQTNKLTSDDLLPKEKKDWFDTPNVGVKVDDANLLADATFRIGLDTQGNYRKGMTTDPRGPIPVPKINICPWNQSSRDPDQSLGFCNA